MLELHDKGVSTHAHRVAAGGKVQLEEGGKGGGVRERRHSITPTAVYLHNTGSGPSAPHYVLC